MQWGWAGACVLVVGQVLRARRRAEGGARGVDGTASRRGGHGGARAQRVPACGEKDVHDVVQHLLLCIIVL